MSGTAAETRVVGFAEALELVMRHATGIRAPGSERVSLLASAGRVLAEDVAADRDQPPFDRATRDGFAVRAEEWGAGKRLRVVGQVRAGEVWAGTASWRAAPRLEIMTGAAVPAGADAVVMIEHVEQGEGEVWAAAGRSLRDGENVVPRGSEARRGDVVVAAGTAMGAAEIAAVAAACGYAPEIAGAQAAGGGELVATGDELKWRWRRRPQEQQIRNSNGHSVWRRWSLRRAGRRGGWRLRGIRWRT